MAQKPSEHIHEQYNIYSEKEYVFIFHIYLKSSVNL